MTNSSRGFSLVEMVVAVGVGATLFGASSVVFLRSVSNMQTVNQQSDVDTLYLLSVQQLRNIAQLKTMIPVTANSPLDQCLSGKGPGCANFGGEVAFQNPDVSGVFGVHGRCPGGAIQPGCDMRVSSSYQWQCAGAACTSLKISVSVAPFEVTGQPSRKIAARAGSFLIPVPAFTSKSSIKMTCASSGRLPLAGFNYGDFTDTCAIIPTDRPCGGPAMLYGQVLVCQPSQDSSCGGGYSGLALYSGQVSCPPPGAPYVGPLAMGGSDGSDPGPPPVPFYGYVPPPPPPPPAPTPIATDGGGIGDGGPGDGGAPGDGGPGPGDGGAPGDGGFPVASDGGAPPSPPPPAPGPVATDGGPIFTGDGTPPLCEIVQCQGDGDGGN